jgi:hypothetical protein
MSYKTTDDKYGESIKETLTQYPDYREGYCRLAPVDSWTIEQEGIFAEESLKAYRAGYLSGVELSYPEENTDTSVLDDTTSTSSVLKTPETGISNNPSIEPRYSHNEVQHWDVVCRHNWCYLLGNASKYIYRCRYKGSFTQDLIKAKRYICKFDEVRHSLPKSCLVVMDESEMSDLNEIERSIIVHINVMNSQSINYEDVFPSVLDNIDNYINSCGDMYGKDNDR